MSRVRHASYRDFSFLLVPTTVTCAIQRFMRSRIEDYPRQPGALGVLISIRCSEGEIDVRDVESAAPRRTL